MAVHLVRHADAGARDSWQGPDEERPLSVTGQRRAHALVDELAATPLRRILTSPLTRCVETVQPLAVARGLEIERHPALAEGADLNVTWALLESLTGDGGVVLCSHGDVIPPILERMERRGVPVGGDGRSVAKGSVWSIEAGPDGRITTARLASAP